VEVLNVARLNVDAEMRMLRQLSCQSIQSILVNQRLVHTILSCWSC